jgi:hypothetical protein
MSEQNPVVMKGGADGVLLGSWPWRQRRDTAAATDAAAKSRLAAILDEPEDDDAATDAAAKSRLAAILAEPEDDDAATDAAAKSRLAAILAEPEDDDDSAERDRVELERLSRASSEEAKSVLETVMKQLNKKGQTIGDLGGGVEESKEGDWRGDDKDAIVVPVPQKNRFVKTFGNSIYKGLSWTKKNSLLRKTPFAFNRDHVNGKPKGSGVSSKHDRAVGGARTKGRRINKNKSRSRKHKKTSVRRKKRIGAFKRRRHKTKKNIRTRRHTR